MPAMGNGEEIRPLPNDFKPDASMVGVIKQRVTGMVRADKHFVSSLLLHAGGNKQMNNDDVRAVLKILKKISQWDRLPDVLQKQGPHSTDDLLQFNLTDAELEELLTVCKRYPTMIPSYEETVRAYTQSLQNPLALQIGQFYRVSKRIYQVPTDRRKEFESADYGDMRWRDLENVIPFRSFAVEFKPPIVADADGEAVVISGVMINRLHDLDPSYSEDAIQIRAMIANSDEAQKTLAVDTGAKQRANTIRNAQKAFTARALERLKGQVREKTERQFRYWEQEMHAVRSFDNRLREKSGNTIEIDMNSPIGASNEDPLTLKLLKTIAGTCLYIANSGKEGASEGGSSWPAGPRDIQVTMLEGTDKEHVIKKLTPQQMLESAKRKMAAEFVEPHPRAGHERTLYRGTERERKVPIKETVVVGKRKFLPKSFTFGTTTKIIKDAI